MAQQPQVQQYIDPAEKPLSDASVNRYDIYSIKGAIDDEIIDVSYSCF